LRAIFINVIAIIFAVSCSFAVTQTLYINRGTFVTIKGSSFPALAVNASPAYNANNAVIHAFPGQPLDLTVINNDSIPHGFSVTEFTSQSVVIKAGAQADLHLSIIKEGIYFYYDSTNYPSTAYLGVAGMIVSSSSNLSSFFWNIREFESSLNNRIFQGSTFSKTSYDPDFFTINGLSYPDIQNDTTAMVHGSVGDTVRIYLANTGQSMHSIHFHGFHTKCLFSTTEKIKAGWSKDTWAIRSMQGLILELVVDKAGRYSVHDHNLVAISAAKTHPNGMFTIMEFK
jgi:FtsP/CotA-like multicopper oxidase with cupredoxin domain